MDSTKEMTKRQFHKSVIEVVVLSEEPLSQDDLTLGEIAYAIQEGDCVGVWEIKAAYVLNGKQVAAGLLDLASDPGFFRLNEDGVELEG